MSLLSTIAHDGSIPAKKIRPTNMRVTVAAIAVAAVIALASLSLGTKDNESTLAPTVGSLTNQEFVDLNTVAITGSAPDLTEAHNSFLYWNVGSLEGLKPGIAAGRVDQRNDEFMYWNTDSIEHSSVPSTRSPLGPR